MKRESYINKKGEYLYARIKQIKKQKGKKKQRTDTILTNR